MLIETQLMEEIEAALKKFNDLQDILKREIDEIAKPNFQKIQELIREFQSKVAEHCRTEFDRFQSALQSGGELIQEWTDDQQSVHK